MEILGESWVISQALPKAKGAFQRGCVDRFTIAPDAGACAAAVDVCGCRHRLWVLEMHSLKRASWRTAMGAACNCLYRWQLRGRHSYYANRHLRIVVPLAPTNAGLGGDVMCYAGL